MKVPRDIQCDICGRTEKECVSLYVSPSDYSVDGGGQLPVGHDDLETTIDICKLCWADFLDASGMIASRDNNCGVVTKSNRWLVDTFIKGLRYILDPPDTLGEDQ
jgi:hypothetical protein